MITAKKHATPGKAEGKMLYQVMAPFICWLLFILVTVVWLVEIIDLPHLLIGAPASPVNWAKASMETAAALIAGLIVYLSFAGAWKKAMLNEQERKRLKILSDIIINDSATQFLALDVEGRILLMSRTSLEKTGYTLDEVLGKDYLSLIVAPREREKIAREFLRLLETKEPHRDETWFIDRDGREYLVDWEARIAFKESGEIDFIYGTGIDVTERTVFEVALKQSEERYRSFIRNIQGIAFQGNIDLSMVFLEGAVEGITGYTEQEFLSNAPSWHEIVHPEDSPAFYETARRLLETANYSEEKAYRIIRKDGSVRWIRESIRNLCDERGNPTAIHGLIYDITSKMEAEESLRRSEERYRLVAENVHDVIWAWDADMNEIYVSPSIEKASGYTVEEWMALPFEKRYPEDSCRLQQELLSASAELMKLPEIPDNLKTATFEAAYLCKDGSITWAEKTSTFLTDSNGKITGIVGVSRDITERKKSDEKLKESEARYRFITEKMNDVIWIVDTDLKLTFITPSNEGHVGYTVEEQMAIDTRDTMTPESFALAVEMMSAELERDGQEGVDPNRNVILDLEFYHKNGGTIWSECNCSLLRDGSGKITGVCVVARVITERRQMEESLRRSEERYRLLAENVIDIIWALGPDLSFTYVSPSVEKLTGYTPSEIMALSPQKMMSEESFERTREIDAHISALMRQDRLPDNLKTQPFEVEAVCKDGSTIWFEVSSTFVSDAAGRPAGLVGVARDITSRKETQEILRRSEEQYRLLAENVTDIIWALGPDLSLTYVSPSVEKITGYKIAEVMALPPETFLSEESLGTVSNMKAQLCALMGQERQPDSIRGFSIEVEAACKDGSTIWVEVSASTVYDTAGRLAGLVGVARDVTSRKKTQEILRMSEERYRLLAENVTDIIWAMDKNFHYTYLSPSIEKMFGYTPEETMHIPLEQSFSGPSYEKVMGFAVKAVENMEKGVVPEEEKSRTFQVERNCKDGSRLWIEITATYLYDENGRPVGVCGVSRDISERKKAEKTLRDSEERYRLLAKNVRDIIWAVDMDLSFTYLSPSAEAISGYLIDEAMHLPLDKVFTFSSMRKVNKIRASAVSHMEKGWGVESYSPGIFEGELIRKDGSIIWVEVTTDYAIDETGRPVGYCGIARDISERKRAEEAIRQSEATYRTIVESTGTAMLIVGDGDVITLSNGEFEKLSGYTRQEMVGKKVWKDFVAPEDIDRMLEYRHLRKTGSDMAPRNYDFRFIDRYGTSKDVYATVTLLPQTGYSLISLLDISARKKTEEELEVSREQLRNLHKYSQDVRERERTRVAREIHDELGQVLTALKMDLSYLAKKLPPELLALQTKANLMIRFVDMTIQSVKRITMDLRPGMLDHLGLVAAIEWQAEEFMKRTGIRYRIVVDPEEPTLDADQSTSIFRIFQETLTNIAKYARATEVRISLTEKDGLFEMIVADNGVGITKDQIENSKSYGLMGIMERAHFCGGNAKIIGQKGKGTTIRVSIPLDKTTRSRDDTGTYRG